MAFVYKYADSLRCSKPGATERIKRSYNVKNYKILSTAIFVRNNDLTWEWKRATQRKWLHKKKWEEPRSHDCIDITSYEYGINNQKKYKHNNSNDNINKKNPYKYRYEANACPTKTPALQCKRIKDLY